MSCLDIRKFCRDNTPKKIRGVAVIGGHEPELLYIRYVRRLRLAAAREWTMLKVNRTLLCLPCIHSLNCLILSLSFSVLPLSPSASRIARNTIFSGLDRLEIFTVCTRHLPGSRRRFRSCSRCTLLNGSKWQARPRRM